MIGTSVQIVYLSREVFISVYTNDVHVLVM